MFSKEQKIWIVENNSLSSTDLRRKFTATNNFFKRVLACAEEDGGHFETKM